MYYWNQLNLPLWSSIDFLLFFYFINKKPLKIRKIPATWKWLLKNIKVILAGLSLIRREYTLKYNPLQYSCLENPMNRVAWSSTVHRGCHTETDTTEAIQHTCRSLFNNKWNITQWNISLLNVGFWVKYLA